MDITPEFVAGLSAAGAAVGALALAGGKSLVGWWATRTATAAVVPAARPSIADVTGPHRVEVSETEQLCALVASLQARVEALQSRHDELQDARHGELTALHRETLAALTDAATAQRETSDLIRALLGRRSA